jgi:hypothetical protein
MMRLAPFVSASIYRGKVPGNGYLGGGGDKKAGRFSRFLVNIQAAYADWETAGLLSFLFSKDRAGSR